MRAILLTTDSTIIRAFQSALLSCKHTTQYHLCVKASLPSEGITQIKDKGIEYMDGTEDMEAWIVWMKDMEV